MNTTQPKILTSGRTTLIGFAFTLVYLAWGGTYLGIRIAIESIPVFLMAGSRFLLSGFIVMIGVKIFHPSGFRLGTGREWRDALVTGLLLILVGNGGLSFAEGTVPSGMAALIVAVTPLWMVIFECLRPGGHRPSLRVVGGLLLGFTGILILRDPLHSATGSVAVSWGFFVLFLSSVGWAAGAIYSRHVHADGSPLLPVARQMIVGGISLLALSFATGELRTFSFSAISYPSAIAYGYLILFGSLLGFTAYVWLMKVSTPARVSTTSYVNPIIAVILGWAFAGEVVTIQMVASGGVIVASVILVLRK